MSYALIRNGDNVWMGGPFDAPPAVPAGQRCVIVAAGYPESAAWSPAASGFVDGSYIRSATGWAEDPAAVERMLVQAVKDEGERRSMLAMSSGGSKKTKYAAKAVEVENWNSLGGVGATTATLTTALGLLSTTARKRKFRYAIKDAAIRGDSVAAAIARFTAGADTSNEEIARVEAVEQAAVFAIKAATTVAAKRAAYAAINWGWTPPT